MQLLYQNTMRQFFSRFFKQDTTLDRYLRKETPIQAKIRPVTLFQELNQGQLPHFIRAINESQISPLLSLRKLTLVHYLLLHRPDLYQPFQLIELKVVTRDEWLNKNVLQPYSTFLYKIINSNGMYGQCKFQGVLDISFKKLFYIINTLKDLFPCVRKMSNLSRYYSHTEHQLHTTISNDYVLTHAYQAQQLYHAFKAILTQMLTRPNTYLKDDSDKQMIKYVLEEVVVKLNEDMKNLFLDKYFFPYGKGYGVKLFREDELTGSTLQFVDQLMCMSLKNKPKKQKKVTLDRILFDESGHLNPQIYHTISHIRHNGQQSFRQSFRDSFRQSFRTSFGDSFNPNDIISKKYRQDYRTSLGDNFNFNQIIPKKYRDTAEEAVQNV